MHMMHCVQRIIKEKPKSHMLKPCRAGKESETRNDVDFTHCTDFVIFFAEPQGIFFFP